MKIKSIVVLALLIFLLALAACADEGLPPVPAAVNPTVEPTITVAAAPTLEPATSTVPSPATATSAPTPEPPPAEAPVETATAPAAAGPSSSAAGTAALLQASVPPVRDDVRLALAYRGLAEPPGVPLAVVEPLQVGTRETLNIPNVMDNTVTQIEAELLAVSDHAYFWFDTQPGLPQPDAVELANVAETFDEIYENTVFHFGSEANPGIDGDPRLHVVNASPSALCGVADPVNGTCRFAGLVNSPDLLPRAVDARSNEREMFVMNSRNFGSAFYLGVLAHEFRHMIEDNWDKTDADWAKEGSATLAAELAGLPSAGPERANMFLSNPDQQLNSWTSESTAPYYGQGYLFSRYLYDRLGEDLYRQLATHPEAGLRALDAVAAAGGLDHTGESLWRDWLAALALLGDAGVPDPYRFQSAELDTVASTPLEPRTKPFETTVQQYAADYYRLPAEPHTLAFSGAAEAALLPAPPDGGDGFWYAQRGNYSNPRLTRPLDLRDVSTATLEYAVYVDIEYGYDFAYASVSTDGGVTWQTLSGRQMQGGDPADNPAGAALGERFYTGRIQHWLQEEIDLTPYAGQEILLRFEYVTDPILTYGGFAVDDISIPEIGFFDGVESDDGGWAAEGFARVGGVLPQTWHLQLITYGDAGPEVTLLPVTAGETLTVDVNPQPGAKQPWLIVAASAPETLEPATYQLQLSAGGES